MQKLQAAKKPKAGESITNFFANARFKEKAAKVLSSGVLPASSPNPGAVQNSQLMRLWEILTEGLTEDETTD